MKKKNWFWNLIVVLTVVVCVLAFVLHYKNWTTFEEGHFQVVSGIYKQRVQISEINDIGWVQKLPQMHRENGFSWLTKEKGVFTDSLTQSRAHVFVDDLRQQKILLRHHDSLQLYFNFKDSIKTQQVYDKISLLIEQKE